MITHSTASLSIISETHSAASVGAVLDLEPSRTAEIGDRKALSGLPRKYSLWVLDAPVSNSGRLAATLRERWTVELADNADRRLLELAAEGRWLATSDSVLLDRAAGWVGLCEGVGGWVVVLG